MGNEARRQELEKPEEVEEEEETTLLLVRKSRTGKTIIPGTSDEVISEGEGQAIQSTPSANGAHKEESTLVNDVKKEKPDGALGNDVENLVFFDKVEGVGHEKMEIVSQSVKAPEEIESAEIDLIDEKTRYDVETVLQKQNTHDLYCPNCNSCITRRVILRKRKRTKIRKKLEAKRNKTKIPPDDDQVHPHHHTGAKEEVDTESGPDLFRCLSCFSFFIPTGNGFRLFRIFGDKSRKENVQNEQVPRRKKNWFTSIFASDNQDIVIEQGTDVPRASEPLLGTLENDGTVECEDEILLSPKHEHSTTGLVAIYGSGIEQQKKTEKIGNDTVITIESHPASEIGIVIPAETAIPTRITTRIGIPVQEQTEDITRNSKVEVIKSIVYGGLAESITSLSVVSSAAGGDAATLNILALGMANLIGGFFVICHNVRTLTPLKQESSSMPKLIDEENKKPALSSDKHARKILKKIAQVKKTDLRGSLWELRCEQPEQAINLKDRYQELLGRRQNFKLHAIVCILSYLVFGLMPIVVYGFSFRQSEERELKLLVVGAASLLCIIGLSIGKAYVCRPPKAYVKTVVNFVILGFMASGISYAAGVLVK
ncbi:membrane protein of ER body-like protein [Dorcoceras hygrometricum]|uniref:Membrane protein of ER body-like protein n=1 Tax=Dorcoceras hygrometricum TaxID=472368 RepID=A0A2Z7AKB0_9LAMI|nr:membrane protein of ER body-like protein [Dorcoceras hygrometricum]